MGITGGIFSIFLWLSLNFYNPYSNPNEIEPVLTTFFMLFLPALLAIAASFSPKPSLMLLAFLWSLPFSIYFVLSPGVFALFGATCMCYFISFIFYIISPKIIAQ
ncbi:hypothetical protein CIB95_04090 [Lottiidibacillus patelloidae]|uniref:Uncharacterized protein n=1 Tax=Lottiidibacillus patelloidae TaxID=2670334 RepID=A0A263BV22_9BACI|nr:hypothetical protein CIB95_04090 [Lottiidibacillus patelloidae]